MLIVVLRSLQLGGLANVSILFLKCAISEIGKKPAVT